MKRVVVKVGTHVLSDEGVLNSQRMHNLVEFLTQLMQKYEVILVSSAAIATGYSRVKLDKSILGNRQALAAIGQPYLIELYNQELARFGKIGAQILITAEDFDSRKRTKNAKIAIDTLLKNSILPIINENDATATEEIVFGDNDQLSAHATYHFGADMLIILSDIDGYYDDDPRVNKNAKVIKHTKSISQDELCVQKVGGSEFATGGIVTKLKAGEFLLNHDLSMFLTDGFNLSDAKSFLLDGAHVGGTLFCKKEFA